MIKSSVRPACGVVARRALRHREASRDVVRDTATEGLRAVPLRQVAAGVAAVRWRDLQGVIVVYVALNAGSSHVGAGQGETGDAVVERRHVGPRDGVVALRAVCCAKS